MLMDELKQLENRNGGLDVMDAKWHLVSSSDQSNILLLTFPRFSNNTMGSASFILRNVQAQDMLYIRAFLPFTIRNKELYD